MGVAEQVKDAAAKEAPDVAEPVISRSEKAGNITAAQADDLRAAAQGLADGKSPRELARPSTCATGTCASWSATPSRRSPRRARDLAKPIIDDAVKSGEITESQAAAIRDKVARGRHGGCRKGERTAPPPATRSSRTPSARVRPLKATVGVPTSSMRKLSLVVSLVSLVVFAVPATAPAKGGKSPAKECKALRAQMGADAFRAAFGSKQGKNALGRCVSAQRKAQEGRPQARPQGLPGEGPARQGDEALLPPASWPRTRLPSPPTTRTR